MNEPIEITGRILASLARWVAYSVLYAVALAAVLVILK